MTDDEIRASRAKLGVEESRIETKSKKECETFSCDETATGECKYCGKSFCRYHLPPVVTTTAWYVQNLDRSDYERWKKYQDDWQRKDGHPCTKYTEHWNSEHYATLARLATAKWEGKGSSRNSGSGRGYAGSTNPHYTQRTKTRRKNTTAIKVTIVGIIVVLLVILYLVYIA